MNNDRKKCSFTCYDGEKQLYGTAAFLKIVGNNGGPDAFVEDIIRKVTPSIIDQYNSRPVLRKVK